MPSISWSKGKYHRVWNSNLDCSILCVECVPQPPHTICVVITGNVYAYKSWIFIAQIGQYNHGTNSGRCSINYALIRTLICCHLNQVLESRLHSWPMASWNPELSVKLLRIFLYPARVRSAPHGVGPSMPEQTKRGLLKSKSKNWQRLFVKRVLTRDIARTTKDRRGIQRWHI